MPSIYLVLEMGNDLVAEDGPNGKIPLGEQGPPTEGSPSRLGLRTMVSDRSAPDHVISGRGPKC